MNDDGTAAADGSTFTGTFEESVQPTRSCLLVGGSLEGARLPATCGNGAVDAGEICDGGVTGDACCTEFCTSRAAGTSCPSDGGACGTSACDGAGACAHMPRAAGTLCRLPTDACDTAEVCDGVSTACPPPARPTEPDLDDDGVLDPCDDCVGQPIEEPRLRLGRFSVGAGRDFVKLRARVRLAPGAVLPDPPTTWKLVELRDANDAPVLYAQVPGGLWNPALGIGWRGHGGRWTFRTREPIIGHLSAMRIVQSRDDPAVYEVRVTTPRATLIDAVPVPPLDLELILDGFGPSTRCGQRRLNGPGAPAPSCAPITPDGVLICR